MGTTLQYFYLENSIAEPGGPQPIGRQELDMTEAT